MENGEFMAGRAVHDRTSMAKRFGGFAPEEEKAVRRNAAAPASKSVAAMLDAFEKFRFATRYTFGKNAGFAKDLDYSADDIQALAMLLADYRDEEHFQLNAGEFLSHLVNAGKEPKYALDLSHLPPLSRLGYQNSKILKAIGNADRELGAFMEGGRIELFGNAGHGVGDKLKGGRITVHGDVFVHIAGRSRTGMKIDRMQPLPVGVGMSGGEIHVLGEVDVEESAKYMRHGRLYQNGTLAVDK